MLVQNAPYPFSSCRLNHPFYCLLSEWTTHCRQPQVCLVVPAETKSQLSTMCYAESSHTVSGGAVSAATNAHCHLLHVLWTNILLQKAISLSREARSQQRLMLTAICCMFSELTSCCRKPSTCLVRRGLSSGECSLPSVEYSLNQLSSLQKAISLSREARSQQRRMLTAICCMFSELKSCFRKPSACLPRRGLSRANAHCHLLHVLWTNILLQKAFSLSREARSQQRRMLTAICCMFSELTSCCRKPSACFARRCLSSDECSLPSVVCSLN